MNDRQSPRPRWLDVPDYVRLSPEIPPPTGDALSRRRARRRADRSAETPRRWPTAGPGVLLGTVVAIGVLLALAWTVRALVGRHSAADAAPEGTWARRVAAGLDSGGLLPGQRGPAPVWLSDGATATPEVAPVGSAAPEDPTEPAVPPTPPPEASVPIVPVIDAAMKEHLRAVHAVGLERGARPGVFAKMGDSITVSTYFLADLGCGFAELGDRSDLAATIDFFAATELPGPGASDRCEAVNAFTRASAAAGRGWLAVQALSPMSDPPSGCPPPNDTPLRCEVVTTRPSIALVMFGTNDLHQRIALRSYEASMTTLVDELLEYGVIPVLSTIPHRRDSAAANARVGDYNAVVRSVATAKQVPLWNFWRALAGPEMVRGGMEPDGIHPNAQMHGANLAGRGLQFGYNQRNLTALEVLAKIRRIVIEDGPAD